MSFYYRCSTVLLVSFLLHSKRFHLLNVCYIGDSVVICSNLILLWRVGAGVKSPVGGIHNSLPNPYFMFAVMLPAGLLRHLLRETLQITV